MNTGDIFTDRKWREYYDVTRCRKVGTQQNGKVKMKSNSVVAGSIIGVLVDMDRGMINFFKDGKDLGQAFCQPELKQGPLFPFIQVQEVSELSIFHPSVYPKLKDPVLEMKK